MATDISVSNDELFGALNSALKKRGKRKRIILGLGQALLFFKRIPKDFELQLLSPALDDDLRKAGSAAARAFGAKPTLFTTSAAELKKARKDQSWKKKIQVLYRGSHLTVRAVDVYDFLHSGSKIT